MDVPGEFQTSPPVGLRRVHTRVVRNGLKGDVISRKSTTDTFLLLNMERGDHTHSYYDRGLMAHSKIDMISIIGRYCM